MLSAPLSSAGDASFVTAYAAEVQTTAGSEAAENPSPAAESGADSTEGAQNLSLIHILLAHLFS